MALFTGQSVGRSSSSLSNRVLRRRGFVILLLSFEAFRFGFGKKEIPPPRQLSQDFTLAWVSVMRAAAIFTTDKKRGKGRPSMTSPVVVLGVTT